MKGGHEQSKALKVSKNSMIIMDARLHLSFCPSPSTWDFQCKVQDGWRSSTIMSTLEPARRGMRRRAYLLTLRKCPVIALTPLLISHWPKLNYIAILTAREAGKCSLQSGWPWTPPDCSFHNKGKKGKVDLDDNQQNVPQHINGFGFWYVEI